MLQSILLLICLGAAPGDLVVLESGEPGSWVVIPEKPFVALEDGRKVIFSSGKPGKFTFIFASAEGKLKKFPVEIGETNPEPEPQPAGEWEALGREGKLIDQSKAAWISDLFLNATSLPTAEAIIEWLGPHMKDLPAGWKDWKEKVIEKIEKEVQNRDQLIAALQAIAKGLK